MELVDNNKIQMTSSLFFNFINVSFTKASTTVFASLMLRNIFMDKFSKYTNAALWAQINGQWTLMGTECPLVIKFIS